MTDVPLFYDLDEGNNPVPVFGEVYDAYRRYPDREKHRVGLDAVNGVRVSTVFLVSDYGFRPGGPPVLWETMTFLEPGKDGLSISEGDPRRACDQLQWRYTSHAEAAEGHARVVRMLREGRYRELADE